ncbi:MAG: Asp-tRNA(Asn)/Glu-tRNA(Gln) amidotransferase subunit GatB [Phycisphaerales bacterium]|nr:Asp-tRNA(Asn)/Glu-tRNA(Gln) amidotransferase subunit GatB [Phycisphaerales bacterium]
MDRTIKDVRLIVGLEVHVELCTRRKMFSRSPSPAHADFEEALPNTLLDATVLALPGSLPVMNQAAVEMSMRVGLALGCRIAPHARWDRKGYFYPDMPKAYQISQYDLPLCADGFVMLPPPDAAGFPDFSQAPSRIGILRAHLEEDAGKLLHEAPGGHAIDFSIVDLNRAGTPLLEIVTQPDFTSAPQVSLFARLLRATCRSLGVTGGVMQKGHMRFEPNINCALTLGDGSIVRTPVVEIKNLNSFRALEGAIEFERRDQPRRWQEEGRTQAAGTKTTRGWDDARAVTFVQREKEDAHDYRYFPDPDLVGVEVDAAWVERIAQGVGELPLDRMRRYADEFALGVKEAWSLGEERDTAEYYDACVDALVALRVPRARAGRLIANVLLQIGLRRANERGVGVHALGASPASLAGLCDLRERGKMGSQGVEPLFDAMCARPGATAEQLAAELGLLVEQDAIAVEAWVDRAIAENPQAADDVRAGKVAAAGRIIGAAMKHAAGAADAKQLREIVLKKLAP